MEAGGGKTMGRRLFNILKYNYRGILGSSVAFIAACCIINPQDVSVVLYMVLFFISTILFYFIFATSL